jgi:CheY-like chemotaxis protein
MKTIELTPRIVIVDDTPVSVDHLVAGLTDEGYEVHVKHTLREALEFFQQSVVDVALLDVNLIQNDPDDRGGIDLAMRISSSDSIEPAIAPECAIIFISRPDVVGSAAVVLEMFNRREGLHFGKKRLAEAYAEKDDTDVVVKLTAELLSERGLLTTPGRGSIMATEEGWVQIYSDIETKLSKSQTAPISMPVDQVLRVVKALSVGQLGTTKTATISHVGKGRSRSVVLSVTSEYQNGLSDSTIIKIAARHTIEMEVLNYTRNVPALLAGGSYPHMTGFSTSRDIAGIAYSELGRGEGLPATLGDEFTSLTQKEILDKLDSIFHDIIVPSGGLKEARLKPFCKLYSDRFLNLRSKSELHTRITNIIRKSKICAPKDDSVLLQVGKNKGLTLPHPADVILHRLPHGGIRTTGYYESLVHGDLHPDNILLTSLDKAFLIDFSHTATHHSNLDYIVMEAMVRSYLLRQCLEKYVIGEGRPATQLAVTNWIDIEVAMRNEDWSGAFTVASENNWGDHFSKLISTIKWLKEAAQAKCFLEPLDFYCAGLGMTCYSFVGLPEKSELNEFIREVLLVTAALSFDKCFDPNLKLQRLSRTTLDDELDTVLSRAVECWRGWIVKTARGFLERLKSASFHNREGAKVILGTAEEALASAASSLPLTLAAMRALTQKLQLRGQNGDPFPSVIVDLMLLKTFLEGATGMGLKHQTVDGVNQVLKHATSTVWDCL